MNNKEIFSFISKEKKLNLTLILEALEFYENNLVHGYDLPLYNPDKVQKVKELKESLAELIKSKPNG